ncbi:MAG: multicopper oxidase domain-containing protein, partial [Pseudohongiellaceae bacterium]
MSRHTMMNRRKFLRTSALATAGAFSPSGLFGQSRARNPLRIPALQTGELRQGRRHYSLEARSGTSRFLSGLDTPTIGFNGDYLGPTLRLRNGEDVRIAVDNRLDEPTTVHWHGLHVPAIADGGPHQVIEAGGSWRAEFQVRQPAGPFWYHSHLIDRTGEQVYRGLAGMILLEDDESEALELPRDYGVDDIPLIIQDRRFNEDGSFRYIDSNRDIMFGLHGDSILVNGTHDPYFVPVTRKVRFRLLNGSNARTYRLAFSDGRRFQQLAGDGSFLAQPLTMTEVTLAPAERCEIVADFADGAPVNLVSLPLPADSPYRASGMMGRMHGNLSDQAFQLLAIEPQSQLTASPALPALLTSVPDLEAAGVDRLRRFELGMVMGMMGGGGRRGGMDGGRFSINGANMHMMTINERVPLGSTEIWEIHNDTMMMHPFHIHHSQFQVKDRDGRPPHASERGFKDTVKVGAGETVRVVMAFERFADPVHAYMYH